MIRRLAVLGSVGVVAALAVAAPVTLARFTASDTAAASLGTATLRPPTALIATGGAFASLAWTPSISTQATGYRLLRSTTAGTGYEQVKTVTPVSATSTTDTPGSGTWHYVLDTYAGSWASPSSGEASVSIGSPTTTSYAGCTAQAAETANAGDNDGYETDPALGCVQDGRSAVDSGSGINTSLACADPGKDRERFSGYDFGLPGAVTTVSGISVELVEGLNNNSGTTQVCVQLSWDGGTSWTAPRTVAITHVPLSTYNLGSPTDTWGHAGWTATQLSAASFRVRLTDMSTSSSKAFELDFLGVSVTSMP